MSKIRLVSTLFVFVLAFGLTVPARGKELQVAENQAVSQFTYARIKPDNPSRSSLPGWQGLQNPPATFPLSVKPVGGKDQFFLSSEWVSYVKRLNSAKAWKFLSVPAAGWFISSPVDWEKAGLLPRADTLAFEWNIIAVDLSAPWHGWVQVQCLDFLQVPNAAQMNYQKTPWLVNKFTVITPRAEQMRPAGGKAVFVPLVCKRKMYVELKTIEIFPSLPLEVTITSANGLNLLKCPNSTCKKIGKVLPKGLVVKLIGYKPRGHQIWGRLVTADGRNGYCLLSRWNSTNTAYTYTTSWSMATGAPLP